MRNKLSKSGLSPGQVIGAQPTSGKQAANNIKDYVFREQLVAKAAKAEAKGINTVNDALTTQGYKTKINTVLSNDFRRGMTDAGQGLTKQTDAIKQAGLQSRKFRYEWLGVMFAGQAIKKQFSGIIQESKKYTKAIKETNREMGKALDDSAIWTEYLKLTKGGMKALGGEGTAIVVIIADILSVVGQGMLAFFSFKMAITSLRGGISELNLRIQGNTEKQRMNRIATEIATRSKVKQAAVTAYDTKEIKQNTIAIAANAAANKGRLSFTAMSKGPRSKKGGAGLGIIGGKLGGITAIAGLATSMIGMSGAAGDASESLINVGNALFFVGSALSIVQMIGSTAGIAAGLTAVGAAAGGAAAGLGALAIAAAPIIAVILAIAAVVAILWTFKDQIAQAFNWGADLVTNFINGIINGAGKVWDALMQVMDDIGKAIGFDNAANDRMAANWGTDMMENFGKGANKGAVHAMDKSKKTTFNSIKTMGNWFSWLGKQVGAMWGVNAKGAKSSFSYLNALMQGGGFQFPLLEPPSMEPVLDDLRDAGTVFLENFPFVELSTGIGGAIGAAFDAFDFTGASSEFASSLTTRLGEINWKSHLAPMGIAAGTVISDKDWTGVFGNSNWGQAIEKVFNDSDWANIFSTVAEALSAALGTPEFLSLITKLIETVGVAMDGVDWTTHFTKAGEAFGQAILDMPWPDIMTTAADALKLAIEEIDVNSWKIALDNISYALGKVISGISPNAWASMFVNMALGLIGMITGALQSAWDYFWGGLSDVAQTAARGMGWYKQGGIVPGTGPQQAVVHGGEMILPAGITRSLLGVLGGANVPGVGTQLYSSKTNKDSSTGGNNISVSLSDVNVASSFDVNSMMDEIERRLKARALAY